MATSKATHRGQMSRQQPQDGSTSGKAKAAIMASSTAAKQAVAHDDRWHDAIQTYCDYFIRY